MNLVVEKDTGESFDDIMQQAKGAYTTLLSAKIAEEARINIDGKETHYISANYRLGPLSLRNAQFLIRGGIGKICIVTYTTAADAFEGLGPALAQSARSIKIEERQLPSFSKLPRVPRQGQRRSAK